jgi:FMN phosphatase YigB (HAD superfamily)
MTGNQVRIVLFDIGGVLVELTGTPMLLSWADNSLSPDNVWVRWLTSPTVRAFETGGIDPTEFSTRLVREMQLSISADELLRQFVVWPKGLYPGALELVRSIPAGYTKATLSNCNCLHWPRFVQEMSLGDAFDMHFPSHLTGKIKPDVDAYAQVIDELECKPSEILYLDDNKLNTDAAEKLGIRAIQVKGVQEAEEALLEAGILPAKRLIAR